MNKERIDILLTERGLADSRSLAQRLVMAGNVLVNDEPVYKPAQKINVDAQITIKSGPKFVSRGGEKLEPALIAFGHNNLAGKVCVDIGASTGGFSDCLLQYGARKVYAVDVGYGVLHWKLRSDERVVVMERTNARFIESFPETIDFVTIDASFISLRMLLPGVHSWLRLLGDVIALIKPQFEAGKKQAAKGAGVIRDHEIHRAILIDILTFGRENGFEVKGLIASPIKGPKGNVEFLVHFRKEAAPAVIDEEIAALVSAVIPGSELYNSASEEDEI